MLDWIFSRARWPFHTLYCLGQACSPPDELYEVGHYHPGKQRNLSNGSSVKDDMRSKYLVAYLRPVKKVPYYE
ncbi:hypothetical protein TNCV_5014691 [Trichonephila clavipes]|nr:hypothetical protein TNCV_5014691 [Trichonephila clavipes]